MYFRCYSLSETWLDNSLKRAVSEHHLKVNMLIGPKHLWNMHENTLIILFHHSKGKWSGKCLPYWNLKSQGWLLTHWLPMTSILHEIPGNCNFLFKCNYVKNENLFHTFFSIDGIYIYLKHFEKKVIVIANVFPILQTIKHLVKPLSTKHH